MRACESAKAGNDRRAADRKKNNTESWSEKLGHGNPRGLFVLEHGFLPGSCKTWVYYVIDNSLCRSGGLASMAGRMRLHLHDPAGPGADYVYHGAVVVNLLQYGIYGLKLGEVRHVLPGLPCA